MPWTTKVLQFGSLSIMFQNLVENIKEALIFGWTAGRRMSEEQSWFLSTFASELLFADHALSLSLFIVSRLLRISRFNAVLIRGWWMRFEVLWLRGRRFDHCDRVHVIEFEFLWSGWPLPRSVEHGANTSSVNFAANPTGSFEGNLNFALLSGFPLPWPPNPCLNDLN